MSIKRISGRFISVLLSGAAFLSGPLSAAERTVSVTDFDRVAVSGALRVVVRPSSITAVRVSGDSHDLDTIRATVNSQTLRITTTAFGWGSSKRARGPIIVFVTTPRLRAAELNGSGTLEIAEMSAPRMELSLIGSGVMHVEQIKTEALTGQLTGSGQMTLTGQAAQANLSARGSGVLDGAALDTRDIKLTAEGATNLTAKASRSALVEAVGSSNVTVAGHPACTVHNSGASNVTCGQ